ncbi:retrovirus-related Pol polyprotein from transposon TNT 1-94 [Gossypium australe]|uniref:Retrovirus-related Pol polyprotein from transposon TNT 1-94 n=1 Tax=Gossypium australe TaxID=47621 RepID=A0A5B6VLX8_9ROSI|nr:retrovirus-related Pol polyprotein from transposon TNT 1-94 [Gossypium australe]
MASSLTDSAVDSRFLSTKKISVVLYDSNYLLWRQQVLLAIKMYKLQRFLDDHTFPPHSMLPDDNGGPQENPKFARRALHSQRKGDLSMKDFLMKIKGYCDHLASCGEVISDHEHVTAILNDLPPEYEPVITIITASPVPYNAQGVTTILLDAEAHQQVIVNEVTSSANIVTSHPADTNESPPAYHPSSNTQGRGHGRSSHSRFQCQLCGKQGHLVDRCYYRFDAMYKSANYKLPPSPQANFYAPAPAPTCPNPFVANAQQPASVSPSVTPPPQALIATPEVISENAWYPDSRATHHLTHSASSMGASTSYNNPGKVYVGNGATLPVLSTGQSSFLTRTRPLFMRSLLFVPGITKNFLSVSKFTKDNQVIFEFLPTQCQVRDLKTKEVLLQGSVQHGLYKLHLHGLSPNRLPTGSAQCFFTSSNVPLDIWHARLGHPCKATLAKSLANCNISLGSNKDVQAERTLGCKLKAVQTDGGGEFQVLKLYLTQQGIVHRFACPYTSAQNGIVERKHRQIVEAGLSMLAHAAMPLTYWNDAFSSAVYLINGVTFLSSCELNALIRNHTWSLCPLLDNRRAISCKWLFNVKKKADGSVDRYKARLVAKGFSQHAEVDFQDTFSPVVRATTIRTILAIAVMKGWPLRQVDVNNAFLNGELTEEIYMSQPPGFEETGLSGQKLVYKLNKALYGLRQAPRAWFQTLKHYLVGQLGFHASNADPSLFIRVTSESYLLLMVYVDGIVITGSSTKEIDNVVHQLHLKFALKDMGKLDFFLGITIQHTSQGLFLS